MAVAADMAIAADMTVRGLNTQLQVAEQVYSLLENVKHNAMVYIRNYLAQHSVQIKNTLAGC